MKNQSRVFNLRPCKIICITAGLFFASLSYAQERLQVPMPNTDSLSRTERFDLVTAHLNKTRIPTGVLYDRVLGLGNISNYEGYGDIDTSSFDQFRQVYYELYLSSYAPSLPHVSELRKSSKAQRDSGYVPIGIIAYRYNLLDSLAVDSGLLKWKDGLLYDVENRIKEPYDEYTAFVAAPLVGKAKGSTIHFLYLQILFTRMQG